MAEFRPDGYTTRAATAEILEPFVTREYGGMRRWQGLEAAEARRLLDELPEELRENRHPGAPSLADGVRLIERRGGTLSGYWVLPPRFDERITLDGMTIPASAADEIDPDKRASKRRELGEGMMHLWWD